MAEELPLDQALEALKTALREHPNLDREVAERVHRLEHFELRDGVLHFALERHPHVLGRTSRGIPSAGYLIIEQQYTFDPTHQLTRLVGERCTGLSVNVQWLVEEEVDSLLDASGRHSQYYHCATVEEVRALAEKDCTPDWLDQLQDAILIPPSGLPTDKNLDQAWREICDEFKARWSSTYVERILERWEAMKADNDEDL